MTQDDALGRADRLPLSGAGLGEAVALVDDDALDRTGIFLVTDDLIDVGAEPHRHAQLLDHREFFGDDAGARPVLRGDVSRDAVAAFLADRVRQELDSQFLHAPPVIGQGVGSDDMDFLRVVHEVAGLQHVLLQQFDRVLDVVHLLLRAAGCGENAAVDDGAASSGGHFLQNDHLGAGLLGLDCGGKACKARSDHQDVAGFVPPGGGCLN